MASEAKMIVAFFFLSLLTTPVPMVSYPYELYQLSLQWPKAFCSSNPKRCYPNIANLPNKFTIHGLWPTNYTTMVRCTGTPYRYETNPVLVGQLLADWPDLEAAPALQQFWQHEWDKHGACTIYTQSQYFIATHQLYIKLDLTKRLALTPGFAWPSVSALNISIASLIHSRIPDLMCTPVKGGDCRLNEVRICYDIQFAYIDCPPSQIDPNGGRTTYRSRSCSSCLKSIICQP